MVVLEHVARTVRIDSDVRPRIDVRIAAGRPVPVRPAGCVDIAVRIRPAACVPGPVDPGAVEAVPDGRIRLGWQLGAERSVRPVDGLRRVYREVPARNRQGRRTALDGPLTIEDRVWCGIERILRQAELGI